MNFMRVAGAFACPNSACAKSRVRRRAIVVALLAIAVAVLMPTSAALADPASPITVTKTASSNPVASGAQLTYTVVVKNTGGAAISNVVMTDQVNGLGVVQNPPALPQLIMTSTKGSCTQGGPNGNLVTCNVGGMAGGESVTMTIRGQVTAGAGTTLTNTASVTGTKSSQNFTTQSNTTSTLVTSGSGGGLPDLTINKTGPTSVAPGAPMTYTLTVNNIGAANATSVKVVDTVPAGITSIAATGSSLFQCSVLASTVTCTGGAVNAGQNATITITGNAPLSGTLTNTAVVDPDSTITETNELNNTSATVNTTVGGPPPAPLLAISKTDGSPAITGTWWTGAGPDPVNPGQKLTYKIQVTNNATGTNGRADDVVVTDNTQGLDASSITASQTIVNGTVGTTGGCTITGAQVKCSLKSLNAGGTQTITITGTVLQSAGSSIFNTATVTGNIKNQGVTNTASEVTTVRPLYDLTITKDDLGSDPVCARSWPKDGQHLSSKPDNLSPAASGTPTGLLAPATCLGGLTYQLEIGNSGIGTATGVEFTDPLPAGLIFDSYQNVDGGGFACKLNPSNVVSCTGGSIGPNSTRHVNLLFVAPPTPGTITNNVYVDPNNTIFEADETNNSSSQTTTVTTGIDLTVWKGDSPTEDPPGDAPASADGFDPIATNGTGTYNIIVDNLGTQDSTGIKVRDTLPAGTKFLSVNADHGFTCSHDGSATGGNVTCIGGSLFGTEAEFYKPPGGIPAPTGHQWATITIKFFATPFVQPKIHNEVRVDPDNEIPEANEANNFAFDDSVVGVGNADKGAFNQLTITKTQTNPASPNPVATNGKVTYNLHVENLGTDPVSNVTVADYLPAGSRFISAADTNTASAARFFCTHDGSATGGTITCTGGDFSGSVNTIPGVPTSRDIKIVVFAPNAVGTYTNNATVDPDHQVPEGNEFDNDSSVDTNVTVGNADKNAFNQLTIAKTQTDPVPPAAVATNGKVTYNLHVENLGTDPVSNVVVQDYLPAGSRFISVADTNTSSPARFFCTHDGSATGGTITCTGGDFSGSVNTIPGVPTSRDITVVMFAPNAPGTYTNNATVDPQNVVPEGNEFDNDSSADTKVTVGGNNMFNDLKVNKTGPSSVVPGATVSYTLTVSNAGTDPAFNVKLRDDLPDHTTFVSAVDTTSAPGAFSCSLVGASVICSGGTLDGTSDMIPSPDDVPASRTIEVKVLAPASISQFVSDQSNISLDIFNRAIVDPDNTIPEGNEANNASQTVKTTVSPAIDLSIDKQGPGSASQNETTTYTITVTNNKKGDGATAFGVKIVDPLPIGLIPLNVEADPGNFHCTMDENPVNNVTCIGDLESEKTVTITISAFVTLESGTLDNEACVDPDNTIAETDETNNCKHKLSEITPKTPDLQINKTADKNSVTAGDKLDYTLNVSNVGTGDTTTGNQVFVTDTVPSQVTVDQVVPDGGWDCSATVGNAVSCKRDSMAAGDSSNIVIKTTAGTTLTAPFKNTADVSGGGDTQGNNNTSSVTTQVGPAAVDLKVVSVNDNPDPVNRSHQLTYTSIVSNLGTSGATGAIVRVKLPQMGVSNGNVAATNGFICAKNTTVDPAGNTWDCTGDFDASGGTNDSTTITSTMTVDPSAPDKLTEVVTADPGNTITESDETNNSGSETTTVSGNVCTSTPCVDLVAASIFDNPDPVKTSDGVIAYTGSLVNVGDSPVNPTAIWNIDITYTGPGSPTLTTPDNSQCTPIAELDPTVHHVRCTSKATGPDWMDLAAGGGAAFTVNVTGAGTAGTATLKLELDQTSPAITEFDEGNNVLTETTTLTS